MQNIIIIYKSDNLLITNIITISKAAVTKNTILDMDTSYICKYSVSIHTLDIL